VDQAGIDRQALAADQVLCDAPCDGHFEQAAQQLAVAKPTVSVPRKGGVVRKAVGQIKTAEPATGEVQVHLLAQPPLGPDANVQSSPKRTSAQRLEAQPGLAKTHNQ
jgi:hypothetical protein